MDTPENTPPKKSLSIRKMDAPETFVRAEAPDSPEPVLSHYQPIRENPARKYVGLIVPVLATVVILAGGWYGFKIFGAQTERVAAAESDATKAVAGRDRLERTLPEINMKISILARKLPELIARSGREARATAESESREAIEKIQSDIQETKSATITAAQEAQSQAQERTAALGEKLKDLGVKVEAAYTKNKSMKLWLNANTRTAHGPFTIDPLRIIDPDRAP